MLPISADKVAAVIILVTIGGGVTVQVTEQIASLGSNLLIITPGQRIGMGQRSAAAAFNMDDIKALNEVADEGIIGAITGRALYEGSIDLAEAQRWLAEHGSEYGDVY